MSSGPYRLVRHLSYTGLLINLLGLGIALGNWLAVLPIIGAAAASLAYRIYVEEHALSNSLGDDNRQYMSETKRLIPFLL